MKVSPGSRFIRPLQVGGLLGLGVFLWGLSLVPIQRSILVCECSVLVSPSEHAKLVELGNQRSISSCSIDRLVCEPLKALDETSCKVHSTGEVAVQRVRLRLGMNRRATATELEEELKLLTSSAKGLAQPTVAIPRGICHAKWRLQVAEHALSRFRLDCVRDGIELPDTKKDSPFRLASQSSSPMESDAMTLFDSLCSEVDSAQRGLHLAQREAQKQEQETTAIFTLGGNPRFFVRGGSLDRVRFLVLAMSCCGIIGLVLMRPKRDRLRKRSEPIPNRQDLMKMLDGCRIPYLGVIPLETNEATLETPMVASVLRSNRARVRGLYRLLGLAHLSGWSRWSERMLAVWIVCFVLRYLLDPPWRELLFQAPLAAFSSILFGV